MRDLVHVYNALHEGNPGGEFVEAVARDQRSFSADVFLRGSAILQKHMNIVSAEDLVAFNKFVEAAIAQACVLKQEEEDLGEVPDEFLDEWTGELMQDPVVLPTSNMTLERSSIEKHLTGTASIDPYNRKPLTVEELIPNDELREKIEAFVRDRKAAASP